ncbi:hypothetical protein GCM10011391_32710 [Pullulanibacillus camelliae]|uniref:Uncharacterized protein n=1 Tax=Pullulanibacillus camelliae TaxID=1707096 RepID=A0A8J3DZL9_9BACL|nr:hypothetical protein [Pullulanibacillus camelliae]GGE51366.1 hypothetical protein GCM10011391_32710 [Pullulanibacillus camelliae]
MPFTSINEQLERLSKHDFHKLLGCLPFWGLVSTANGITERYSGQRVSCFGLNDEEMDILQQRLQHTGLTVNSAPNQSAHHFMICFESRLSHPITIHKEKMNYQLKPLLTIQPIEISQLIYKNVWLLPQKSPIRLTIDADYRDYAPEWISYLILHYFLNHEGTLTPPHLSYADFQFFVHRILYPINPLFAQSYLETAPTLEQWPKLPLKKLADKRADDDLQKGKENPVSSNASTETPFLGHHVDQHTTINPFKKAASNPSRSTINPFKKEH